MSVDALPHIQPPAPGVIPSDREAAQGQGNGNGRKSPGKRRGARRRRRWPILIVAILIAASVGGWAWRRRGIAAAAAAAKMRDLVTVHVGTVLKSVDSSGKIVSNLDVEIKCRASGEVVKLPFDISQPVKKGDLLCQLDPTDEQLAVRLAEATVAQSAAKLAQAKDDLRQAQENLATTRERDESALASAKIKAVNLQAKADRQKELMQQKLGSREDLETAQTEAAAADAARDSAAIAIEELKQQEIQLDYKREAVNMAAAQLASDQVTLDTQKQQLIYTTVTSPLDGVVSALNVQKGAIVASGMSGFSGGTTIMTLSDLSHVFVTATVDESDIGGVRVGQAARITAASFPTRTFDGRVTRIATKGVNSSNVVTFEVKVEVLDEHKDLLRPEMTGNVTIIQDERHNVLTLPAAAITLDGGKAFVTMADGQRRAVTLGLRGDDLTEITTGVKAGDKVVVKTFELPTRWKNQDD